MMRKYDVIIVGAGPAGCGAATFLARDGYDVLLLDKAVFPRDKVCGDAVSPSAIEVLDRMGLSEKIERKEPWKVYGMDISSPEGRLVRATFSNAEEQEGYGYVFPRKDLDLLLFRHVQDISNVDVLENCEVVDLVNQGETICGVKVSHNGFKDEFRGHVLVGADGAHSMIARRTALLNRNPKHLVLAARAYFHDVEGLDHHTEIHCEQSILPGYLWIFPTGEGSANIGIGGSYRSMRKANIRELFDSCLKRNRFSKEKLIRANMLETSFKVWSIPLGSYVSKRSHKNVLLIGDAGSLADPLTGEGIYQALTSGECAAKTIGLGLRSHGDADLVGNIYEKEWRKKLRCKEYLIGYFVQRAFSKKFLLNLNVRRAIKHPNMTHTLAAILCHKKSKIRLIF